MAIQRVEQAVKRFVDRELVTLLNEIGFTHDVPISVKSVHASTNRINVRLAYADSRNRDFMTWEYLDGRLIGTVTPTKWIDSLGPSQREQLSVAVAGLFQRSGADRVIGSLSRVAVWPISWDEWVAAWSPVNGQIETYRRSAG